MIDVKKIEKIFENGHGFNSVGVSRKKKPDMFSLCIRQSGMILIILSRSEVWSDESMLERVIWWKWKKMVDAPLV